MKILELIKAFEFSIHIEIRIFSIIRVIVNHINIIIKWMKSVMNIKN